MRPKFQPAGQTVRFIRSVAEPPNCAPKPFSISVEPNPACWGFSTGGPPVSRQYSFTLSTGLIIQLTVTRPAGPDNAPYFDALVASSCRTSESITTVRDDIGTEGPSATMRSGLALAKGSSVVLTTSLTSAPSHFLALSTSCARPSETRRAPNLARDAGSVPSRKVCVASDWTVASVFFTR